MLHNIPEDQRPQLHCGRSLKDPNYATMLSISSLSFLQDKKFCLFVCFWCNSPQWARASSFTRFLDHTRRTAVSRTPLDEWSARHRDIYLTTHNTHNKQTSMPPVGFEPTISCATGTSTR